MNRNTTVALAKAATLVCLVTFLAVFPITVRAAVYSGMHISYCIWFLLNHYVFNRIIDADSSRKTQLRQEPYTLLKVIVIIAIVGVFYSLPGWLAINNPQPAGNLTLGISVGLFFLGSMLASRFSTQSTASAPGVKTLPGSLRNLTGNYRYYGEIIRYGSFALLSGSPWAWFVVLCVVALEHPYGILRWLKEVLFKNRNAK